MASLGKVAVVCFGNLLLLCACTTTLEIDRLRQSGDLDILPPAEINNVPFYAQQEYQCGPAALAMVLSWSGVSVTPQQLVPLVYVPERKGSFQAEIAAAARNYGRIPYVLKPGFRSLMREINAGHPVLVFQNLGLDWIPNWHYAVVTGINPARNQIVLHSGTIERHVLSLETFERTWQRANKWALVVMRPNEIPASAEPLPYVKAISYFERKGDLELAKIAYQTAVDRWPRSLLSLMAMGNVYYQTGELKGAQRFYEKALEVNHDYAPAHNNLAQVLMEQGDLASAHHHATEAVALGGEHAKSYRETLTLIEKQLAAGQ